MGRSVHCCGLTDGEILSPPHEERGHSHDAAHATVQIQGTVPVQRCRQCTGLDESRDVPDRHRVGHFALVHPPKKLPIFCLDVRLRSATDMRNNSMYCERVFWSASRSIASKNASPCGVDNAETDRTRLGDSAAVCQVTSAPQSWPARWNRLAPRLSANPSTSSTSFNRGGTKAQERSFESVSVLSLTRKDAVGPSLRSNVPAARSSKSRASTIAFGRHHSPHSQPLCGRSRRQRSG
jgi:hypothetical protein